MKDVFTTGQVADLCGVSPQVVIGWITDGYLPFYFVPGSSHRRVTKAELVKFMTANSIPLGKLESDPVAELVKLRGMYAALAERCEQQSELLSKLSEVKS